VDTSFRDVFLLGVLGVEDGRLTEKVASIGPLVYGSVAGLSHSEVPNLLTGAGALTFGSMGLFPGLAGDGVGAPLPRAVIRPVKTRKIGKIMTMKMFKIARSGLQIS